VCGVEWPIFRATVEKYRKWLEEQYGGIDKINERLVFAHNDVRTLFEQFAELDADHAK
jgi:choline kinase